MGRAAESPADPAGERAHPERHRRLGQGAQYRPYLGLPVILADRRWGTMSALYLPATLADDTEERAGEFLELLNCAITQAETRAELITSRARLVDSAEGPPDALDGL